MSNNYKKITNRVGVIMMIASKLAKALGISAMILLMIVMVLDIGIGTGTIKPPVGQQVLGPVLGLPSIILFLASFGVGYY